MKEHPILFSTAMVHAILSGEKTQTRRVVKPPPDGITALNISGRAWGFGDSTGMRKSQRSCPFGAAGDVLWVRETWHDLGGLGVIVFKADPNVEKTVTGIRWKPSIHLPRRAARIFLEITGVRCERLTDISEADARAEGVQREHTGIGPGYGWSYRYGFMNLWDSINGPRGFGWEKNPWVWVIEFKKIAGGKSE